MDAFVDRLFDFMAFKGLSQNKFEEACGLAHTSLRGKIQGPTTAYLMKIATAFPELNLNWLFRGSGEMTIGEKSDPAKENRFVMNDIHDNDNVILNYVQDVVKGAIKEAYKEIKEEYHL